MVDSGNYKNYTWRYIPKQDLKRKHKMILNFDFDLSPLDDVLEVLLVTVVGGVEFISYKTCIYISKEIYWTNYKDWFRNGRDI